MTDSVVVYTKTRLIYELKLYIFLYIFFDIFKFPVFFKNRIWFVLKNLLFHLEGGCKNTGNCCRNIMLYDGKKPITNLNMFILKKYKKPEYTRFIPICFELTNIYSFNCSCLSRENKCLDYEKRPAFCRNYPFSFFISEEKLADHCGYRIALVPNSPSIYYEPLKLKIEGILSQEKKRYK